MGVRNWKYHADSGAFEYIPSAEVKKMIELQNENKLLKEENKGLRNDMDSLLEELANKGIIDKKGDKK